MVTVNCTSCKASEVPDSRVQKLRVNGFSKLYLSFDEWRWPPQYLASVAIFGLDVTWTQEPHNSIASQCFGLLSSSSIERSLSHHVRNILRMPHSVHFPEGGTLSVCISLYCTFIYRVYLV